MAFFFTLKNFLFVSEKMYICQNNSNNQVVENIVKKDLINRKNELKVVAQAFIFDCGFVGYRLHFHSSNHCHNFDYCLN